MQWSRDNGPFEVTESCSTHKQFSRSVAAGLLVEFCFDLFTKMIVSESAGESHTYKKPGYSDDDIWPSGRDLIHSTLDA